MAKVFNYMIVCTGLILLLKWAGLPVGADAFLTWIGAGSTAGDFSLSAMATAIGSVFAIGAGIGIVIGFFTKSQSESFIIATLAGGIFTMVASTMVSIVSYTSGLGIGWLSSIVFILFAALLSGFGIAMISWWRGADG